MLAQALFYAGMGIRVFPLHSVSEERCSCGTYPCGPENRSAGKHPRTGNGFKPATTGRGQVEAWWGQWPDANIGSPDFDVVDVDEYKDGAREAFSALEPLIPSGTPWTRTGGGGRQFFFNGGTLIRGPLGPGIDSRYHDSNYVVLPPSIHRSGERYGWGLDLVKGKLAGAPALPLSQVASGEGDNLKDRVRDGERIDNNRNKAAFRFACALTRWTLDEELVRASTQAWVDRYCRDPHEIDTAKQVRGALKLAKGEDLSAALPTESEAEHSWKPFSLVKLAAAPPAPPTIGGLLYPGKRTLLSGETESLKTWLALILAKAELDIGLSVAWADLDAMGPGALHTRLQALGVDDETIDDRFLYFEPSEQLAGGPLYEVCQLIKERGIRLFVIDSFNPILGLHGLDPGSTLDVETFWRAVADPITRAGAAPTLLDHVVKSSENRGKYAYGSERKASGAIVHVGMRLLEPFARGGTGRALLQTQKDRPGYLPRPSIGRLVLESDGTTVTYRLEADHSRAGDTFRPTFLMERVSEWLAAQTEPVSRNEILRNVSGKQEAKRLAIDVLVAEGFAASSEGRRNSQLVAHVRAYREDEVEIYDEFEDAETTVTPLYPDRVPSLRSSLQIDCDPYPPLKGDTVTVDGLTVSPTVSPGTHNGARDAIECETCGSREIFAHNGRCKKCGDERTLDEALRDPTFVRELVDDGILELPTTEDVT